MTKRFEETVEMLRDGFQRGIFGSSHTIDDLSSEETQMLIKHCTAPFHGHYSETELKTIEAIFLNAFDFKKVSEGDEDAQFTGLISVVGCLAKLDGIDTIEEQYTKFKRILVDRKTKNKITN